MKPLIQYPFINWVDGMKIRREHFLSQENAVQDRLRDILALLVPAWGYGLLPAESPAAPSFHLEAEAEWLVLGACRAVTRGGFRVEIVPGRTEPLRLHLTDTLRRAGLEQYEGLLDVVLVGEPWHGVPFGALDPAETPPRQPFTRPACRLEIVPPGQPDLEPANPYILKVGQIRRKAGGWQLNPDFIPACMSPAAHPLLWQKYQSWAGFLTELEDYAGKIYYKFDRLTAEDLQIDARIWAKSIITAILEHKDEYRLLLPEHPPVYFLLFLQRLARNIYATLQFLPQKEDALLEYLSIHLNPAFRDPLAPGELAAALKEPLHLEYAHDDLAPLLLYFDRYQDFLRRVFRQAVDLRFIRDGHRKRYESVYEEDIPVKPRPGNRNDTTDGFKLSL